MDELEIESQTDQPPHEYLLEVFRSQAFRRDARQIVELDKALLEKAIQLVEQEKGFLDLVSLRALLERISTDETVKNLLVRFIWNLQVYLHNSQSSAEDFRTLYEGFLRTAFAEESKHFLDELLSITGKLASNFAAIARYFKALKLVARLGDHAGDVSITSDLRPIFNATKSAIEGGAILSTMKISYTSTDDGAQAIELITNRHFLLKLRDEVTAALNKHDVISQFCERSGMAIANLDGELPR